MNDGGDDGQRYQSDAEITKLVEDFESCVVPPAQFDHGAHLAVAALYLSGSPYAEAAGRMREGLRRYTTHNNAQASYNETLTLFWLKVVRHFLSRADARRPLAERANALIAAYGSSQLAFDYYSRALAETPEAKASWVEPDLKPMDF